MNEFLAAIRRSGFEKLELDYHLLRVSMLVVFAFFSYQKWFEYEAERLVPYISHGPLIWWLYPLLGVRGASTFLGMAETTIGLLLLAGFWNKIAGALGALGSMASFLCTTTIIPFMPDGWEKSAGGFPAMTGNVPFLMKDVVLLAVSFYLFKQDLGRVIETSNHEAGRDVPVYRAQPPIQNNRVSLKSPRNTGVFRPDDGLFPGSIRS